MDTQKFNPQLAKEYVETEFDKNVLPTLMEYIKIPNLSKHFDPEWSTNGNLERAANLLIDWAKK
jgi:acetylornithine deacetylase/succinyl-diaminopimelate desuccinylase-like protein